MPLLHDQILSNKISVKFLNSVYEMEKVASAARVIALVLKNRKKLEAKTKKMDKRMAESMSCI